MISLKITNYIHTRSSPMFAAHFLIKYEPVFQLKISEFAENWVKKTKIA